MEIFGRIWCHHDLSNKIFLGDQYINKRYGMLCLHVFPHTVLQEPSASPVNGPLSCHRESVNIGHSVHSSRRVTESQSTFTETESVKKECTIASEYTPASC